MALAQETEVMLLDEPTTYLDLAHQLEVLDLLDELNEREGRTIVLVLHDLNQASRYADHLVAMRDGHIRVVGRPIDVVTEAMVSEVFGVDCRVMADPMTGTPLVIPRHRLERAGEPRRS
jgi:iron complex transport system ATP-binding protein